MVNTKYGWNKTIVRMAVHGKFLNGECKNFRRKVIKEEVKRSREARRGPESQRYGAKNVSINIVSTSLLCHACYMSHPSIPLPFNGLITGLLISP